MPTIKLLISLKLTFDILGGNIKTLFSFVVFFPIVLFSFSAHSFADDFEWTGAGGINDLWRNPNNWVNVTSGGGADADGVPDNDDSSFFNVDARVTGIPGLSGETLNLSISPNVTVMFAGLLLVGNGSSGAISNEGILSFDEKVRSRLLVSGDVSLDGGGEIVLRTSTRISLGTNGSTLTNIGNTIKGTGIVEVPVTNESLIRSEGGFLNLSSVITNTEGEIEIAPDGILIIGLGGIVGGNIHGETGSSIQASGSSAGDLRGVTLSGEHTVTSVLLTLAGTITNEGTLTFEDTGGSQVRRLGIADDVTLDGGGEVVLVGSFSQVIQLIATGATLTNVDNTIRGIGTIQVPILNIGTLFADSPVGDLDLNSEVTLTSFGEMSIRFDGPMFMDSGFFDFAKSLELFGTLKLIVGEAFEASIGDSYEFMEANNLIGSEFEQIDSTMAENSRARYVFDIVYSVDSVSAVVLDRILLGDANEDEKVDLLDVAIFVQILSDGGFLEEADINGDGAVDLLDVAPFVELLLGG